MLTQTLSLNYLLSRFCQGLYQFLFCLLPIRSNEIKFIKMNEYILIDVVLKFNISAIIRQVLIW